MRINIIIINLKCQRLFRKSKAFREHWEDEFSDCFGSAPIIGKIPHPDSVSYLNISLFLIDRPEFTFSCNCVLSESVIVVGCGCKN